MVAPGAGLVTPEGVVVQFPTAGPGTRILARGVDTLIQALAIVAFVLTDAALSGGSLGTVGAIADFIAVPMIFLGYPAIAETAWRGRTLGKMAVGLRVVERDGAPERFRHALIRSILFIVDGLLVGPVVGILFLLITKDTVRLGDLAAGTIVVNERSGAKMPAPATFAPVPGYEGLAASLDVGRLAPADYEVVRAFLLRAGSLWQAARWTLATDIAGRVSARIGFQPPAGVHPEAFLQTVAAAYQSRQYGGYGGYGGWGGYGGYAAALPYAAPPSGPPPSAPPLPSVAPPPVRDEPPAVRDEPPAPGPFAPPS